jgi:hypothetical protein
LPSTAPRVTPSARRPAPLAPVTYEAEAPSNTLGGSAHVARYRNASGGRIVRDIGDWGEDDDASGGGAGTLRFNGVAVPAAGVYQLTFFYVNLDNEPTSTAVITTSGERMITVTVDGGSACCAAKTVQVSLANGANSITFANANGHAPSIDKIIIVGP